MGTLLATQSIGRQRRGQATQFLISVALSAGFLTEVFAGDSTNSPSGFSAVFLRWTLLATATNRVAVEVSGLSQDTLQGLQSAAWTASQWQRLLTVFAESPPAEPLSVRGAHHVQSGVLRFVPAAALEPGLRYRAVFDAGQLPGADSPAAGKITAILQVPPHEGRATTVVTQVHPSADVLPENLARLHVHFSAPMRPGAFHEHLRLLNAAHQPVSDSPFAPGSAQWSADGLRLTMQLAPGSVLKAGRRLTLVISRACRDANGNPLKQAFLKSFLVGPPDHEPPDPHRWGYQAPAIRTREPLAIDLAEPLDSALALQLIQLVDAVGRSVPGQPFLVERERIWKFLPLHSWKPGRYSLVIEAALEDLAGNSIRRPPLAVELIETAQPRTEPNSVKLPFELR